MRLRGVSRSQRTRPSASRGARVLLRTCDAVISAILTGGDEGSDERLNFFRFPGGAGGRLVAHSRGPLGGTPTKGTADLSEHASISSGYTASSHKVAPLLGSLHSTSYAGSGLA